MAANDFDYARQPMFTGEISVKNASGTDLVAGNLVKLDAANPVSATQPLPGVARTTTDEYPFGVCLEAIPNGKSGRVAIAGIAQVVASAAITAGATVQASTVGKVVTAAAAKPQIGQALTAAGADGDKLLIVISIAKNA